MSPFPLSNKLHVPFFVAFTLMAAGPASAGALRDLLTAAALVCEPALPYLCANIHVSCAGRSRTRAPVFMLDLRPGEERVVAEDDAVDVFLPYSVEGLRVHRGESEVVLRPAGTRGYIRVLATGRYSLRHYASRRPLMSHGVCR